MSFKHRCCNRSSPSSKTKYSVFTSCDRKIDINLTNKKWHVLVFFLSKPKPCILSMTSSYLSTYLKFFIFIGQFVPIRRYLLDAHVEAVFLVWWFWCVLCGAWRFVRPQPWDTLACLLLGGSVFFFSFFNFCFFFHRCFTLLPPNAAAYITMATIVRINKNAQFWRSIKRETFRPYGLAGWRGVARELKWMCITCLINSATKNTSGPNVSCVCVSLHHTSLYSFTLPI